MTIPWTQVEKYLQDHKREIGWKGGPCLRLHLKSGETFLIYRTVESNENLYAALTFLPEETIDENPRFHFIAVDPKEIYLIEAFEPEPRRPEQLKRLAFTVVSGRGGTDRFEKPKPST
jgi:hypothetical protein